MKLVGGLRKLKPGWLAGGVGSCSWLRLFMEAGGVGGGNGEGGRAGMGFIIEKVPKHGETGVVVRLDLPSRLGGPQNGIRGLPEAREVRPPCGSTSLLSSGRGTGAGARWESGAGPQ